jgi:NAD(P)-dependent dehydrogenase (short-subunit alcohol dehydrogenase family)
MTDVDRRFGVAGRTAIVTGGGRGIGREIVRTLAAAGADVAIVDIDSATAADAAREVEGLGRGALAVRTDVADLDSVRQMVGAVMAAFGRIDILVNDAATYVSAPAEEMTPEDWRRIMAVNVDGVYWCCREAGAHMLARGSGSIVNIASMSGSIVNWPQPQACYNASKAAVIHLTKSLASEWATRGVRVNAVSPGYTGTEMTKEGMRTYGEAWLALTPTHRIGEPVDIANAVLYLASDAAAFATGTNLVVDGGYSIW